MPLSVKPLKPVLPVRIDQREPKQVLLEYLYLDLQVCDRCMGTEQVLDEVVNSLLPAFKLAGYELDYRKTKMETPDLAQHYHFKSSPTIRVNGGDIFREVQESDCGCCGEISGTQVDCRVFAYDGRTYEVPPAEMLAEAILKSVFGSTGSDTCAEPVYQLPGNLADFYKGKNEKSACNCTNNCC